MPEENVGKSIEEVIPPYNVSWKFDVSLNKLRQSHCNSPSPAARNLTNNNEE